MPLRCPYCERNIYSVGSIVGFRRDPASTLFRPALQCPCGSVVLGATTPGDASRSWFKSDEQLETAFLAGGQERRDA